ncbi:hypothetical protein J3R83DRAFT_8870 [Lanmaoa asiatica]|nr:hypothetical protein J3R83DRAFT_8870 [Lanmaoa asiatica]
MPFARSFRANTACRVRQLASRQPTPPHTISSRPTVSPGSLIANQSACQRSFTFSRHSPARSSPLLFYPRWPNSKSGKPTDVAEPEESEAADSTRKTSSNHVRMEGSQDEDSAASGSSAGSPPSSSSGDDSDPADSPPPPPQRTPTPSSIAKQSVPEIYPQVLALPIARRPLFPGFYKAVVVRNPAVVAAIKEMMKRGQPYLGAFLLKDENTDSDVITDINSVHPVGVFAQITSVFSATTGSGEEKEEGLTAVLYPHRRIKISELLKAGEHPPLANVAPEDAQTVTPPETPPSSPSSEYAKSEVSKIPPGPVQTSFLHNHAISIVQVENLLTHPYNKDDQYIRAFMSEIVSVFKDIAQLNPLFRDQITNFSINQVASNVFDEPDKLADFAAAVSSGEVGELQDVLESLTVEDRLRKALLVLKKELINAQLQSKLSRDVDSKIAKRQREYYLMEQLKGIKKELGMESDGKDKLIEKFKERAAALKMPEGVRKVFDEELNKLMGLEPAASEANVTRNYLEWLTQVPWGQHSSENYSIAHAQKVLDEDHYGLKDVKDRILEFLAVGHRRTYVGALPGKIIQALKRVGTENPLVLIDEVDKIGRGINGDPASALLEMLDPEQNNGFLDHYMDVPVDLSRVLFVCTANTLDTIPAPLLDRMEVLEVSGYVSEEKCVIAEQYLGPQAKEASGLKDADVLLDPSTVDVLIKYYCRESGVRNLKKHIDKIYRKAALKLILDLGEDVFPEPTPNPEVSSAESRTVESQEPRSNEPNEASTESSTHEPSERKNVTTQERQPLRIPENIHVRITPENLKDYVGPPVYHKDRMYVAPPPPGVSTGLGYLGNGSGAVMPVEATSMPGKGGLQLTGKLGEVIRESAQIGLSWVKAHAYELGITTSPDEQFLTDRDIHVHMPEGSIGKEGPSAGTAILSAFVSLFTKTQISPDIGEHLFGYLTGMWSLRVADVHCLVVAMTGEISLVGQVLPVGGLKEKILAAHRAGIKTILAPAANRADIEENVPESVKTGIHFVYVEDVREVLHEVFKSETVAERWKDTLSI